MPDESDARKARQKDQAQRILLKQYEALGNRHISATEAIYEAAALRTELDEMWRLCGLGEPPEFAPSLRLVKSA